MRRRGRAAAGWWGAAGLVASLCLAAPGHATMRSHPDPVTLWREDFRDLERSDGLDPRGWTQAGPARVELIPRADHVDLRAAAGRQPVGGLVRYVGYDLSLERPGFPWLVLDLAAPEASPWAGLDLRCTDRLAARTVVTGAAGAGRWVFDLRRHLPALRDRSGLFPLSLTTAGATVESPGPATSVVDLACLAAPEATLALEAADREGLVQPGERVTISVALTEPAKEVAIDFQRSGPPARPWALDGRSHVALARADGVGRRWSTTLTIAADVQPLAAGTGLVRATIDQRPPLWTSTWFTVAARTAGPTVRVATPVRTATLPRLDGSLTDELWRQAPPYTQFRTAAGAPAAAATEFRLLANDDQLFLGLICRQPGPPKDDRVEVWLGPRGDQRHGLRFVLNAAGEHWTAPFAAGEESWEAEWTAATATTKEAWTAELAIPFGALHLGDGCAEAWDLNVVRRRGQPPGEVSGWALPAADEQAPPVCGRLERLPDLVAYRVVMAGPAVDVYGGPSGYTAVVHGVVTNHTRRTEKLSAQVGLRLPDGRWLSETTALDLAVGRHQELRSAFRIPRPGRYELVWQVESAWPPTVRLLGRRHVMLEYRPLALRWLPPEANGEHVAEAALQPYLVDETRLVAELRRGEQVVAAKAQEMTSPTARFHFPADLPPGEYVLQITARRQDLVLGSAQLALKVDKTVEKVQTDPHGPTPPPAAGPGAQPH